MNRRHGLASIPVLPTALALTLGPTLATKAPAAHPAPRPNVVMLIADDWSFPHAGVYGDKVVVPRPSPRGQAVLLLVRQRRPASAV